MEKIKLNNQVVRMRKYVKQAKVHIINKLVKQVKLLQNRKGNEVQIQKAKRKAERFLEEIALLKKIKPDDVSKLALSKAKDWREVLQQKNSTLYDRCIAMLANYGAVQKEVEIFHNANQELVLNITDLIKQWEEKNKFFKDSPKIKKLSGEKRTDISVQKANLKNENLTSGMKNQSDTVKTDNRLPTKGQNEMCAVEPPENDAFNKLFEEESCSDDDVDNVLEVKNFDNDENPTDNTLEINESDNDADPEKKTIVIKESESNRDFSENTMKAKEVHCDENEENSMEIDETDSDDEEDSLNDSERSDDITESKKEAKHPRNDDSDVSKPQQCDVSEFIKKNLKADNSTEKKLKAIALLNLDELQGFDEIPISCTIESNESEEGDASEDETNNASQNKRNDPFFLGCGGEDSEPEEKLGDSSKDNDFIPRNKNSVFSNKSTAQRERSNFFQRHENSSQFSHNKKFQKFPNSPRRDSTKFKNERDNFMSYKKDKFMSKNYHDKYQGKSKRTFDRDSFKNQKDFKMKCKMYPTRETYGKRKHEDNSKNEGNRFSVKNEELYGKDKVSDKPLHPSWEAKRKQKKLINTSFQGKRIVFGD